MHNFCSWPPKRNKCNSCYVNSVRESVLYGVLIFDAMTYSFKISKFIALFKVCMGNIHSWTESALPVIGGLLLCNAQCAGEITQTQVALPIPGAALRVKRLFFAALSGDKCGIAPSFRGFPHVMDCTPLQKAVPRKPHTLEKLFPHKKCQSPRLRT